MDAFDLGTALVLETTHQNSGEYRHEDHGHNGRPEHGPVDLRERAVHEGVYQAETGRSYEHHRSQVPVALWQRSATGVGGRNPAVAPEEVDGENLIDQEDREEPPEVVLDRHSEVGSSVFPDPILIDRGRHGSLRSRNHRQTTAPQRVADD